MVLCMENDSPETSLGDALSGLLANADIDSVNDVWSVREDE